jgi:hypothetical protein
MKGVMDAWNEAKTSQKESISIKADGDDGS